MSSAPPSTSLTAPARRVHRLPLAGLLALKAPADIWYKRAYSVVVAAGLPNITLLLLGRIDLAMFTMAGSLCALYCHNLPYAARARTLAGVCAGMVAGLALALVVAALTDSPYVLVAVGALMAAAQKGVCDTVRIGPPGPLILTFISSATLFAPSTLGQVPGRVALAAGGAVLAWAVCMAPALVRGHGPERIAVSRALRATAAYVAKARETGPEHAAGARAQAAGATHAAWQSLLAAGTRTPVRRDLEHLLVHAEAALFRPAESDFALLRDWADRTTGAGPVPRPADVADTADELAGVAVERAYRETPARRLLRGLGPGSPLLPIVLRTAVGCALAGYLSYALGVGRPYWAIVTAASIFQVNITLTWSRGVQRVVGNLVGVALFVAIAPLSHLNQAALVLCCLAFNFGAEALIGRNYWLGSVCVTPMALLITEFGHFQNTGELAVDRIVDTLVGAAVGILAAALVTNRRATGLVGDALADTARAQAAADAALAAPGTDRATLESGRRRLAGALVELRHTVDAASGEWWQRALPQQEVLLAEQAAHRTLAATVRRQGLPVPKGAST
ncbi:MULTISPECIES: FUSC family protein [Streptomyces diastaticus group]|uniref:FUSC family protein n=1 Tax=Streptomyces diastaticus group TaxID=2849069 RepID=UPI0035D9CEE4|nr:FUSC family protein [Streptomyces gougerotii]